MAKRVKDSGSAGETSIMCVRVPYGHEPRIFINGLWGLILTSGKFSINVRELVDRKTLEVDLFTKITRQKRTLLMVTTKGKNEAMFTFICHPRHEPLERELKEFFENHGLEVKFMNEVQLSNPVGRRFYKDGAPD